MLNNRFVAALSYRKISIVPTSANTRAYPSISTSMNEEPSSMANTALARLATDLSIGEDELKTVLTKSLDLVNTPVIPSLALHSTLARRGHKSTDEHSTPR